MAVFIPILFGVIVFLQISLINQICALVEGTKNTIVIYSKYQCF